MKKVDTIKDIIVIDIETTGIDVNTSEIIGISSVVLQSQKVTGLKYETWCQSAQKINKKALEIIGKKAGYFEDQPLLSDAINYLSDFINNRRVVASNPKFCSEFLYKFGISSTIKFENLLDIVKKKLDGFAPYYYEDYSWDDWIKGPLQRILPCCYHLNDDFDTMLIAKFLEILYSDKLRSQLESIDWYDD